LGKKIIFISNLFPPILDGVGDYTFNLGNELSKNHEIYYLHKQSLNIQNWSFKNIIKAYHQINSIKPDLVSLQYVPFSFQPKGIPLNLCLLWALLKVKSYHLQITFHEVAIGYNRSSLRQNIGATLQRIIAICLCILSKDVFTSVGLYFRMLKPFNKNTQQVLIGSNLPACIKTIENEIIILCSFNNRITSNLIIALNQLKSEKYQFKLIGIGKISKHLKTELEKTINDLKLNAYIKLLEPADAADLSFQLAHADIYLQLEWINSIGKGGVSLKSGALMAAMAHQLPIISTFGKMTDMELLNEQSGIVFTNSDIELYQTLKNLMINKNLRIKLGKNAHNFYTENCGWNIVSKKYQELLND